MRVALLSAALAGVTLTGVWLVTPGSELTADAVAAATAGRVGINVEVIPNAQTSSAPPPTTPPPTTPPPTTPPPTSAPPVATAPPTGPAPPTTPAVPGVPTTPSDGEPPAGLAAPQLAPTDTVIPTADGSAPGSVQPSSQVAGPGQMMTTGSRTLGLALKVGAAAVVIGTALVIFARRRRNAIR